MTSGKIKLLFWGTIAIGMVLPIVVMMTINLIFDSLNFLDAFNAIISSFFDGITSLGFIYWVLHSIPFIFLAFLIRSQLGEKVDSPVLYILRLSKVIGAWVVTIGFTLYINIVVLISDSSTAVLAYLFIPFYETVAILVGYGCGWLVGKIIIWAK